MTFELFTWYLARVAGMTCFLILALSILSGVAIRTGVLGGLGSRRGIRELHGWLAWLWIPVGLIHVLALLADQTAQVSLRDLVIPFQVPYGRFAIGLGTLALEGIVVVTLAAWFRNRLGARLWLWVHRLGYVAFATTFAHALLAGSDLSSRLVSGIGTGVVVGLLLLSLASLRWGALAA